MHFLVQRLIEVQSKIFNKELSRVMFPLDLFGRVVDGNYVLYARACASAPEFALDLQFLAQVFNDMPSIFVKNGCQHFLDTC